MSAALRAGIVYFAVVFAAGFALGTLRVTVLVPRLGELGAVALELPLMLAVSWLACGWLLRSFAVPRRTAARAAMGALGLALLLAAELVLGSVAFGRTLPGQLAAWQTLPGALGLAAQLAFGLFPLMRRRAGRGG
jgi:hypothetical protein